MVTSTDTRQEERKRGRRGHGGAKIEVKSGGGGIGLLVFGGALIAAAAGAALAAYRAHADKRRREAAAMKPKTEAYLEEEAPEKSKGLQSILELTHRDDDRLTDSLMEVKENPEIDADSVCDYNVQELLFTQQEKQALEDLAEEEGEDEEEEEEERSASNLSEDEVKESSETEEEGDVGEEGSDSTGASSIKSNSDAVWPAEVIEAEKQPLLIESIEVENKLENKLRMEEQLHGIKEDLGKVEEDAEDAVRTIMKKIKEEVVMASVVMNDHPRGTILLFLWIFIALVLLVFFGCVHLHLSHHITL
ncbi:uncharacterized protein [Typha latifolia]|uniref:uncharacterized protein n=1 Tax=Typha latifolia TaxID=4733 RepID=UPI003C2F927C